MKTWTFAAANGVRFARVRWEINFLLTFETAPFICKHPVYLELSMWKTDKVGEVEDKGILERDTMSCLCYPNFLNNWFLSRRREIYNDAAARPRSSESSITQMWERKILTEKFLSPPV